MKPRKRLAKALLRLQAVAAAQEDPVEIARFMAAHKRRRLGYLEIKDNAAHSLRQLGLNDVLQGGTEMKDQLSGARQQRKQSQAQDKQAACKNDPSAHSITPLQLSSLGIQDRAERIAHHRHGQQDVCPASAWGPSEVAVQKLYGTQQHQEGAQQGEEPNEGWGGPPSFGSGVNVVSKGLHPLQRTAANGSDRPHIWQQVQP